MRKINKDLFSGVVLLALSSCAPEASGSSEIEGSTQALAVGEQLVYRDHRPVPQNELMFIGDPSQQGGEILEGNPEVWMRFDYISGPISAGVFQITRGKVRVYYPSTEHSTIIWGKATLTDENGVSHTYRPGDSYVIPQGSVILVDVHSAFLQKSFMSVVEE